MKKTMAALAGLLALSLAACSGQSDCTQETLTKKSKELSDAVTAAVIKDPTKGASLTAKMQEVLTKYSGTSGNTAEACKAVDELIKTAKE